MGEQRTESRLTVGLGGFVVEDCLPGRNDMVAWRSTGVGALCCGPIRRRPPYPLVEEMCRVVVTSFVPGW